MKNTFESRLIEKCVFYLRADSEFGIFSHCANKVMNYVAIVSRHKAEIQYVIAHIHIAGT